MIIVKVVCTILPLSAAVYPCEDENWNDRQGEENKYVDSFQTCKP
jgi:hypothetical protein